MTIPFTSVSLGFHSMVEPYRSDLHKDVSATFERFGITNDMYAAYLDANRMMKSALVERELARADDMLAVANAIQKQSTAVRANGGSKAIPPLTESITKFLDMAASWVAAEVALGITAPDQPVVAAPGELIRRMYLLLYSSEFRKNLDPGTFDKQAWDALLHAVTHGSGSFDTLLPHCRTLCGSIADEFNASLWPIIW